MTTPGARIKLYAATLAAAAAALAAVLFVVGVRVEHPWFVLSLAVVSAIAEHGKVRITDDLARQGCGPKLVTGVHVFD